MNKNHASTGLFNRLKRDQKGSFVILWALVAAIVIFGAGMAIDYARSANEQTRLRAAVDAAVLAGSSVGLTSASRIEQAALENFNLNYQPADGAQINPATFTFDTATRELTGTANGTVPTLFSKIFDRNMINIGVRAVARTEIERVEFVLSLDQSGSMFGSRQTALENALRDFQAVLEDQVRFDAEAFIGIVPWQTTVNIGTDRRAWVAGLDRNRLAVPVLPLNPDEDPNNLVFTDRTNPENIKAALSTYDFDGAGFAGFNNRVTPGRIQTFLDTANRSQNNRQIPVTRSQYPILSWRGCVMERDDVSEVPTPPSLSIASFAPTVNNRSGLAASDRVLRTPVGNDRFRAYYQPPGWGIDANEINGNGFFPRNNPPINTWDNFADLTDRADNGNTRRNPNIGCIRQPMTYFFDLSSSGQNNRLTAAIDALNPDDDVAAHTDSSLGMLWALRMLDPDWRPFWNGGGPADLPSPFNSTAARKVIILMTDGRNGVGQGLTPQSWSAYGDLRNTLDPSINTTSQADENRNTEVLNLRALRFCELAKNLGVEVYTIGFDIDPVRDRDVNNTLANCASRPTTQVPNYYLIANQSNLGNAFQQIARQQARISIVN
ncbi:MAG: hypothetical protein H2045_06550 [Rhizobiales bacterium]|nr:hypothetical protein [Hyphomicrobiales bacterium]